MRILRRLVLIAMLAVVAVGTFVAWNIFGAWPVPAGYEFPRHSMWGAGPAGLFGGTLVEEDGCILTEAGDTVIWPPFSSLAIVDGEPVVRLGPREIRMGEPVALGGGWYDGDLPAPASGVAGTRCPGTFFLTTGPAD